VSPPHVRLHLIHPGTVPVVPTPGARSNGRGFPMPAPKTTSLVLITPGRPVSPRPRPQSTTPPTPPYGADCTMPTPTARITTSPGYLPPRFGHFRSPHHPHRPLAEHESAPTPHHPPAATAQNTISPAASRPFLSTSGRPRSHPSADGVQAFGVRVVVRALGRGSMPLAAYLLKTVTEIFSGLVCVSRSS
jgi:hypothetical protein